MLELYLIVSTFLGVVAAITGVVSITCFMAGGLEEAKNLARASIASLICVPFWPIILVFVLPVVVGILAFVPTHSLRSYLER